MDKQQHSSFEKHDYRHIERALSEVANRTSCYSQYISRQGFISASIGTGILLVCLGIFIVLLCWSYHILNKPVSPIYVEKPIYLPVNQDQGLVTIKNNADSKLNKLRQNTIATGNKKDKMQPIYNYSIFKSIPFSSSTVREVIVGMRYEAQNDSRPQKQWCYVERENDKGVISTVSLAKKDGTKLVKYKITPTIAKELGLTTSQLLQAQNLCSFE